MKKKNTIIIVSVIISIIIIVGIVIVLLLNRKDNKGPKIIKTGYLDYEYEEGNNFAYSPRLEKLDKQDTDSDGLSDLREEYLGTDKEKYDTDEDGLSDGDEIKYGTNPLEKDKKCDGKYEVKQETNTEKINLVVNAKSENPNAVKVSQIPETSILSKENVPGMVGNAYDLSLSYGEFESATITFEIKDNNYNQGSVYSLYYFNEETVTFEKVANQKQIGNKITAELEHFSKYVTIKDISLPEAQNAVREKYNISIDKSSERDTDGDGFKDDEDVTPYSADSYKDIYHYARNLYKGKDVLFVLAYQPIDHTSYVYNINGGVTGHTYLAYYDSSEDKMLYYGFRSFHLGEKEPNFLLGEKSGGAVLVPGGCHTYSEYGDVDYAIMSDYPQGSESECVFTDAVACVVDESTLDKLNEFCRNYHKGYQLYTSNCTTFAMACLKELGIPNLLFPIEGFGKVNKLTNAFFAEGGSPGQIAMCMELFYGEYAITGIVKQVGDDDYINTSCTSKYAQRIAMEKLSNSTEKLEIAPVENKNDSNSGSLKVGNHTLKYGNYESTAGEMEPGSYGTITLKPNGAFHIKSNYDEEGATVERIERDCDGTYEIQLNQPTGYPDDYADYIKFMPEQGKEFYFQVYQDNSFSDQWHFYNYVENSSNTAGNSSNQTASVPNDIDDVYKDYIKNKEYENYTKEWETKANGYCMLDINQDGQKELIIIGDTDLGWHYVQINTYDKSSKKVVEVENTFVYMGLEYSKASKQLTYTNVKPFQGAMGYGFYEMKNNKLERVKSVGSDDINSYFIHVNGQELKHVTEEQCRAQFDGFESLEYSKL